MIMVFSLGKKWGFPVYKGFQPHKDGFKEFNGLVSAEKNTLETMVTPCDRYPEIDLGKPTVNCPAPSLWVSGLIFCPRPTWVQKFGSASQTSASDSPGMSLPDCNRRPLEINIVATEWALEGGVHVGLYCCVYLLMFCCCCCCCCFLF